MGASQPAAQKPLWWCVYRFVGITVKQFPTSHSAQISTDRLRGALLGQRISLLFAERSLHDLPPTNSHRPRGLVRSPDKSPRGSVQRTLHDGAPSLWRCIRRTTSSVTSEALTERALPFVNQTQRSLSNALHVLSHMLRILLAIRL